MDPAKMMILAVALGGAGFAVYRLFVAQYAFELGDVVVATDGNTGTVIDRRKGLMYNEYLVDLSASGLPNTWYPETELGQG